MADSLCCIEETDSSFFCYITTIFQLKNTSKLWQQHLYNVVGYLEFLVFPLGLPWWVSGKELAWNAGAIGDAGSIPGPGRYSEGRMAVHSVFLPG